MKHLTFIALIGLLLIQTSACKKNSDTTPNSSCRLTKVTNTNIDTAQITYDTQGRVLTYGSLNYGLYNFTYGSGLTASATTVITDTSYHFSYDISLDAQGRATFITKHYSYPGSAYTYTFSFQYDAEGHIIRSESSLQGTGIAGVHYYLDSLVYTNGNLTAKYSYAKDNVTLNYNLTGHLTVDYGTDINKIGLQAFVTYEEPISVISGWNSFYHLFGASSKNLPSVTKYYDNTGTLFYQWNYSFLLNENGYPTEENIVRSVHNPGSINRKFAYSCP